MKKNEILLKIKQLYELHGTPPGWGTFQKATGLKKSKWFPEFWFRWSDAIIDAGFKPNEFVKAHSPEFIVKQLIELIRELNHFPIDAELILKKKKDKSFPNSRSIHKLGNKKYRIDLILEHLRKLNKEENQDVILICEEELKKLPKKKRDNSSEQEDLKVGFVYLIKHGSRNEYKIGKTYDPLRREGEIRLQLPEKIKPIHYIETDDPSGIEAYWHNRFKEKRINGEWFKLLGDDVKTFKRWKKIF